MIFKTIIPNLNPKRADACKMVQVIYQAAEEFVHLFDQADVGNSPNSLLCLTLLYFDRFANELAPNPPETLRAKIMVESQSGSRIIFYILKSERPDGDDPGWFLSSDGKHLDTPAEIFSRFLEEFKEGNDRQLQLPIEIGPTTGVDCT